MSKRRCRLHTVNHIKQNPVDVNISVLCRCGHFMFSKYACRVQNIDVNYSVWRRDRKLLHKYLDYDIGVTVPNRCFQLRKLCWVNCGDYYLPLGMRGGGREGEYTGVHTCFVSLLVHLFPFSYEGGREYWCTQLFCEPTHSPSSSFF